MPPLVGVAVNVTLAPAHILLLLAAIETEAAALELTVTVTAFDVAVLGLAHVELLVTDTRTTSPLFRVDVMKVLLLPPCGLLFTDHWYAGVLPALVALAVKVTCAPLHIVVALAVTLTAGADVGLTTIVIAGDVAVVGLAQPLLLVITTVTTSLFANELLEYVALLVPTLFVFTFHW